MQRLSAIALLLLAYVAASASQQVTRVKYINGYPREGLLEVFIITNNYVAKNLVGIPYGADTDWFYLPYGEYTFQLGHTGAVNYTQTISMATPSQYIIASQDQNGKFYFVTVYDDSPVFVPAEGLSYVSIVNILNDEMFVDVGIGADTTRLASAAQFYSVTYPRTLPNGTYMVDVRRWQETGTPLASLQVNVQAGKNYLFLVFGNTAQSGEYSPRLGAFELADWSINARVAFVHGLPAADLPVNVIANDIVPLFRNVNYKNVTDYQNIPVGIHNITVENEGSAAITIIAFFNGFTESTLYATSGPEGPTGILLLDDNTAPETGETRIRVLHGTTTPPAVDVLAPEFVFPKLAYGQTTGYTPVNVSELSFTVKVASSDITVYSLNLPLNANTVVTVLATGDSDGSGSDAFTFIVVIDATYGANGNLRAFHAVADGPQVNVKVDGNEVVSDLPFKGASSYSSITPGLYRVSVHAVVNDVEIFRSPVRIDAEGYFTAVAGGSDTLSLFQLRDDSTPPAASTTHLRVVHASATSPEVNIQVNRETVSSLVYTEAFGYVPLPSTSYVVRVATTAENTQVFNASLALEADTVISAFAVGQVGNDDNPFEVVVTIDFDYRPPVAPSATSPPSSPSANPSSSPSVNPSSPSATPSRTPSRISSATAVMASSSALIALALLF